MTQSNFERMSRKGIRAYILEHRDDEDAFRFYADKVTSESADSEVYPAPQSIDDLKHFPQLLEKHLQERKERE